MLTHGKEPVCVCDLYFLLSFCKKKVVVIIVHFPTTHPYKSVHKGLQFVFMEVQKELEEVSLC